MNTAVKSIFPALVENNTASTVEMFKKYTSYLQVVSGFTTELTSFLKFNNASSAGDFVNASSTFYTDLDKQLVSFDNDFIAHWVQEYNSSVQSIKDIVAKNNTPHSFFIELSDSIGLLTNISPLLTESVEPINDLTFSDYPAPVSYPVTAEGKLRDNTKTIASDLSRLTTASFRRNIVNIQVEYATSYEAHGSNLITDVASLVRHKSQVVRLTQALNQQFDRVFKLVSYYSTINDAKCYNPGDVTLNKQLITNLSVYVTDNQVDLQGVRIQPTLHYREINTLSTRAASPIAGTYTVVTSKLPVPVNGTAVKSTTKTAVKIPTPAANDRATDAQKVQATETAKKAAKPNTALDGTSKVGKGLPNVMPEYNRGVYAFSGTSPFSAIRAIKAARDVICSTYSALARLGISLTSLGKFTFPPRLPSVRLNFAFKKTLTQLAIRVQQAVTSKILALIPSLPKMPDFSRMLRGFNKDLFKCNPNNKR